eukprot:jgi/Chrzof1/6873/Cz02g01200.t1
MSQSADMFLNVLEPGRPGRSLIEFSFGTAAAFFVEARPMHAALSTVVVQEYWTYHKLPQQLYLPKYTNSSAGVTEQLALSRLNPVINNTATLWQMGNE